MRDLKKSKTPNLGPDWQMMIAYNAALQLTAAALSAYRYRVRSESHHYRMVQSLKWTLDWSSSDIKRFEAFRKKRNTSSYRKAHTVTSKEAEEMLLLAYRLHKEVLELLKSKHPDVFYSLPGELRKTQ